MKLTTILILLLLYMLLPFAAGIFEIGDRAGPKIYPVSYHEAVYDIGRNLIKPNSKKQHSWFGFKKKERPWFYSIPE